MGHIRIILRQPLCSRTLDPKWAAAQVANLLGEEIPQIYALCGRTSRASLRVLRPGLAVAEMAVSPLPGAPAGVWTVRVELPSVWYLADADRPCCAAWQLQLASGLCGLGSVHLWVAPCGFPGWAARQLAALRRLVGLCFMSARRSA